MFEDAEFEVDDDLLLEVSKPLFYGFSLITGASILVSTSLAGSMLGMTVLTAIAVVSSGIAESMNKKWSDLLETIAVASILFAVVFASYFAMMLSSA